MNRKSNIKKCSGKLFLILGPSGSGKGVVISALRERFPDGMFPVSCTTRQPRPGERQGEVYYFISRETFEKRIKNGDFLEWAVVHDDHLYGTLKKPIFDALSDGNVLIREVDVQGMHSIVKVLPKKNVVSIFLTTPSWDVLRGRILRRHKENEVELSKRRASYYKEMREAEKCDYIVHSNEGKIPQMVEEVCEILEKER
ncbi:guanylate kinase [Candidatus Peregrinibacteria bacterium]|nr:guanylate kinase [Candidatus Peregrinibacteria bacterium]